MRRFEGHFLGFDQTDLFFQTWMDDSPRGTFVITHGLAEHGECYHPLGKTLAQEGWEVFAWDLRGHGRSEGKRGFARHVSEFERDLAAFIESVVLRQRKAKGPLILMGHSMGGLVTLRALANQNVKADVLVLSSPALGISVKVPQLKEQIAHFANRWIPTLTLHNEIKYSDLSRDQKILSTYPKDSLRHDKISPGIFLSMMESFQLMPTVADKINMPVLMQLAGDERLVSSEASRSFFELLPNKKKQLILYPESLHEIYNDLDREKVIEDLKKFINPYLGG